MLFALCGGAAAQDLAPAVATRLTQQFQARAYAPDLLGGVDLIEAEQVQDTYVGQLIEHLGGVVGYKAGLTSPLAQQRLGVDQPLLGFLLCTPAWIRPVRRRSILNLSRTRCRP